MQTYTIYHIPYTLLGQQLLSAGQGRTGSANTFPIASLNESENCTIKMKKKKKRLPSEATNGLAEGGDWGGAGDQCKGQTGAAAATHRCSISVAVFENASSAPRLSIAHS